MYRTLTTGLWEGNGQRSHMSLELASGAFTLNMSFRPALRSYRRAASALGSNLRGGIPMTAATSARDEEFRIRGRCELMRQDGYLARISLS
jgi:hypothetical protein